MPQARARKKESRQELVRQLLGAGVEKVGTIQHVLSQDYGIDVEPKTIRNDISIVRKG